MEVLVLKNKEYEILEENISSEYRKIYRLRDLNDDKLYYIDAQMYDGKTKEGNPIIGPFTDEEFDDYISKCLSQSWAKDYPDGVHWLKTVSGNNPYHLYLLFKKMGHTRTRPPTYLRT